MNAFPILTIILLLSLTDDLYARKQSDYSVASDSVADKELKISAERNDTNRDSLLARRRFKERLKKFDKNNDGQLSDEERRMARNEVESRVRIIEQYDTDGDGKISQEERLNFRNDVNIRRKIMLDKTQKAKRILLERFDANGDSILSKQEKDAASKKIKAHISKMRKQLTETYDLDSDGKLSQSEKNNAHIKEKQKMLDLYDTDKNGKLDAEEKKVAFDYMLIHQPYRLMHQLQLDLGKFNKRVDRKRPK